MYTVQIGKHSSQAKKLLMAARHERETRFAAAALYQTQLTVDRLTAASVALTVAEPASALAWLLYASLPIHMNDVPVFSSPAFSIPAFSVAPSVPSRRRCAAQIDFHLLRLIRRSSERAQN